MNLLKPIIERAVKLDRPNARGWHPVLCKVCSDHGRKGKRAAFMFDEDVCSYHCFNCGIAAVFDPANVRGYGMPKKMADVLESFGINKNEWQPLIFELTASDRSLTIKLNKQENYEPQPIELPPYFTPIDENGDDFDRYAIEYLRDERAIDWKLYPFLLGRKTVNPNSKRWYGRLIIPFYKDNKLVFFQGRDLTGIRQKKYLSPDIPRENVIYGYEQLFRDTDEPLYIVEGWFDAWHLEGVAVLGNKMTQHQLHWINKSRRQKVVVPDRYGKGYLLAEQALEQGWSVSTPDIGDCKDPNEAIMKYGKIYTLMSIRSHTYEGFEAALRLKFYCEEMNKNDARSSAHVRKGTYQAKRT